jgi:hypothetical protein
MVNGQWSMVTSMINDHLNGQCPSSPPCPLRPLGPLRVQVSCSHQWSMVNGQ